MTELNKKELELTVEDLLRESDAKKLFENLGAPECQIERLKISVYLSKDMAKILGKNLAKNTSIRELIVPPVAAEELIYLKALKKNRTIEYLSLKIPAPSPKLGSYFKSNHTLKHLSIFFTCLLSKASQQHFGAFLKSIGEIRVLESFKLECGTKEEWTLEELADALKGNKHLKLLQLNLNKCQISQFKFLSEALSQLRSLTSFEMKHDKDHLLPESSEFVLALKGNTSLKYFSAPERFFYSGMSGLKAINALLTMPSLTSLKLTPHHKAIAINIEPLIVKPSPLKILEIKWSSFCGTQKILKILQENTSLTRLNIYPQSTMSDLARLLQANRYNYNLDIYLARTEIQFVDAQVVVNSYNADKMQRLKKISDLFSVLQTILLPADRGLFGLIPDEILFAIYRRICYKLIDRFIIEDHHIFTLFQHARTRELLRQYNNRPDLMKFIFLHTFK